MEQIKDIELLVNIRQNIRDVLVLWSSREKQLEYQRNVAIAQVSLELFCQWDDFYNPEDDFFLKSFTTEEINTLKSFNAVIETIVKTAPDQLPPIKYFVNTEDWSKVNKAAIEAISKIKFGINRADFIAQVDYLSTEEGGRNGYVLSGYRPHFRLTGRDELTSAEQVFLNNVQVFPGESVIAEIRIVRTDIFAGLLHSGMSFTLEEGNRAVAKGLILKVLNPILKKEN